MLLVGELIRYVSLSLISNDSMMRNRLGVDTTGVAWVMSSLELSMSVGKFTVELMIAMTNKLLGGVTVVILKML